MIPNLKDLEDAIINAVYECEPGKFFTSVEYDDEDGNALSCEVSGWIDDEDGDVSISECNVYHYNADDEEIPYGKPDKYRIEKEASYRIHEAWQEAKDIQETEDMLSWGGWFI